jgi:FixJ family two-component response regulator
VTKDQIVHVTDDDPAVVATATTLLRGEGMEARGYGSARDFLAAYAPLSPGCLLLDVRMPEMSGLDLQQKLAAAEVSLPVIIMTGSADVATAVEAMKRGAVDFLQKPFTPEAILSVVRRALTLDTQLNAQRVQALMVSDRLNALTERERAIVEMAAGGQSSKEIARSLGISPRTVDAHRANILKKLQVASLSSLMRAVAPLRRPAAGDPP